MAGTISPSDRDVLLAVDVQNDFCPGGRLAVPRGDEIVPAINRLCEKFRHVVLTQDWHPVGHLSFASSHPGRQPFDTMTVAYGPQVLWPDHCVQDTAGAEFRRDLVAAHAGLIIRKGFRARSIPTRRSTRTTTPRRPGSPGIFGNAASRACSWPGSPSISASASRPRTPTAAASRSR